MTTSLCEHLRAESRLAWARWKVRTSHYTHSVPSGKSHYFKIEDAIVVYSIPANQHVGRFLLGRDCVVWELARLWAPDGHERNLLTRAVAASVPALKCAEPGVELLVSYADPNVGHHGGVYRAASWLYTGQAEDGRYYTDAKGQVVSRRKFHSGDKSLTRAEILARGYKEVIKPGRHRFARGLSKKVRKELTRKWGDNACGRGGNGVY